MPAGAPGILHKNLCKPGGRRRRRVRPGAENYVFSAPEDNANAVTDIARAVEGGGALARRSSRRLRPVARSR